MSLFDPPDLRDPSAPLDPPEPQPPFDGGDLILLAAIYRRRRELEERRRSSGARRPASSPRVQPPRGVRRGNDRDDAWFVPALIILALAATIGLLAAFGG